MPKLAAKEQQEMEKMENGEVCAICIEQTLEPYGRPGVCEDCGGDFVLAPKEPNDPPGWEGGFADNH